MNRRIPEGAFPPGGSPEKPGQRPQRSLPCERFRSPVLPPLPARCAPYGTTRPAEPAGAGPEPLRLAGGPAHSARPFVRHHPRLVGRPPRPQRERQNHIAAHPGRPAPLSGAPDPVRPSRAHLEAEGPGAAAGLRPAGRAVFLCLLCRGDRDAGSRSPQGLARPHNPHRPPSRPAGAGRRGPGRL